jgi:Fe2+ or Zn2+ uptake regulation protein
MRTPMELTTAFRERGLKSTPQRQAIFAQLHGNLRHPTAEAIYIAIALDMPSLSLRTVYQTLNDLVAMGELSAFDLDGGAMRFDPNTADHHHAVCDRCGSVSDIQLDVASLSLGLNGFVAESVEVVLRGCCAECQPKFVPPITNPASL